MDEEIKNLQAHNVYSLHQIDRNFDRKKVLKTKWCFALKYNHLGEVDRFKARLVACGYDQTYGLDYDEVFSPTLNSECVRLLCAIALVLGFLIHTCDITGAYLNADIDKEIFICQPLGYSVGPDYCLKLNKGLYGLKQSGRLWYLKIKSILNKMGFKKTQIENNIFYKPDLSIIVGIYVDDFKILGRTGQQITEFVDQLNKIGGLKVKHSNQLQKLLGMNFTVRPGAIYLDQHFKIENLAKKLGIRDTTSQSIPILTPGHKQIESDLGSPMIENVKLFQEINGSLLHISRTSRPDIQFAVSQLSQFSHRPTALHLKYAKQVVQYLLNTKHLKLCFTKSANNSLVAYSDSDFANSVLDRKSITGAVIYFNDNLIFWSSVKQKLIAQSTDEAEVIAMNETCRNLMYYRSILNEIFDQPLDIKLYSDSNGALRFARDGVGKRSKHFEVKLLYVKDLHDKGLVRFERVDTKDNIADVHTKFLDREKFKMFRDYLRLVHFV